MRGGVSCPPLIERDDRSKAGELQAVRPVREQPSAPGPVRLGS